MNEVKATKLVTEGQNALIIQLIQLITAIMAVDLSWASKPTSSSEAADSIDTLKAIRGLVMEVANLRKAGKLNNSQIEAIRAKINGGPNMQWVNAARCKLAIIKAS